MDDVRLHYEKLIEEGNDPVMDPPELAAHMDGWDGHSFLAALMLDGTQDVLEIGVGTGRLALRTAPMCRSFTGVDLSPKTVARAGEHLAAHAHVRLICADFLAWDTEARFDVIYSSLTFQHFADKQQAADRVAALLRPGGRAVISLDKDQSGVIDYGVRRICVYPDDPAAMAACMRTAGLTVLAVQETAFACILTAVKGEES